MAKYEFHVGTASGKHFETIVEGKTRSEASEKIEAMEEYQEFLKGERVRSMQYIDLPDDEPEGGRFILTKIDNGFWAASDLVNGVRIEFKPYSYKETNRLVLFGDKRLPADKALEVIRELHDWLKENHGEMI